jgi:antitoxin component YwqK of YwqJK toxin-antitoxin module
MQFLEEVSQGDQYETIYKYDTIYKDSAIYIVKANSEFWPIEQRGEREGSYCQFYFDSNHVKLATYYRGGLENGIQSTYYSDFRGLGCRVENGRSYGPLRTQVKMINGQMEGKYKGYSDDVKCRVDKYKNGLRHGRQRSFNNNTGEWEVMYFINGRKQVI